MKKCLKCNIYVKEDDVYCSGCGLKVKNYQSGVNNKSFIEEYDPAQYSLTKAYANEFANLGHTPHGYVLKILSLYEIILSFFLILYVLWNDTFTIVQSFMDTFQLPFLIILIFTVWGIVGFSAGILVLFKKQKGITLTKIFIYSTGLLLAWPFIYPFLVMLFSFIYFNFYDPDEFIFNKKISISQ